MCIINHVNYLLSTSHPVYNAHWHRHHSHMHINYMYILPSLHDSSIHQSCYWIYNSILHVLQAYCLICAIDLWSLIFGHPCILPIMCHNSHTSRFKTFIISGRVQEWTTRFLLWTLEMWPWYWRISNHLHTLLWHHQKLSPMRNSLRYLNL